MIDVQKTIGLIIEHADAFEYTAKKRASTTPNPYNKEMHTQLAVAVAAEDVEELERIVRDNQYTPGFISLCWCLNMHSTISSVEHEKVLIAIGEKVLVEEDC